MHRDLRTHESRRAHTIEYIAAELGLPFEFFAGACAGYAALAGLLLEVDAASRQTTH
jgi:hypothetical protein